MAFDIGSMVRARGRDWVVLPDSGADFLLLKPLGGSDAEVQGVYAGEGGEEVTSAAFAASDKVKPCGPFSAISVRAASTSAWRRLP